MKRRLSAVIISVVLLSSGWLGGTGLTLLGAFVPLLWLSDSYGATRRDWWRVFGWAALTFVLWNAATIWWIWGATPVGPFAATLASTTLNMIAFMLYRTVSQRAPRALGYTLLTAGWIATEYWYTVGEFSWPWLILGNGFSHDVWAVQWYEYTGVFGGSLWVLVANIAIYEAWRTRSLRSAATAAAAVLVPAAVSLAIYFTWHEPDAGTARVTVVQPNVPVYEDFDPDWRIENLLALAAEAPADTDYIIMPETAVEDGMAIDEGDIEGDPTVARFAEFMRERYPSATLITGAKSLRFYRPENRTATARAGRGYYYDIFNSAVGVDSAGLQKIYHKGRLVIGVEKMPLPWLFEWLRFLVIDLGGTVGQLGVSSERETFRSGGTEAGAAICYEGLYGDFYGGFIRRGAQAMLIISNDGWWGDTPGYRHLFTISRLRAIEHRRAIARSANTGRSGFISARGDVGETLGWDERGTIASTLALDTRQTFYTRYGDYLGRIAEYVMLLCVLYYTAYRVKRRNYLVK
ncbi:MAG: apolipoprotein N-acyltransferase [Alistipes sp.]|nr:apolipoprotein N-acyltransferase [Alistipes sp.]